MSETFQTHFYKRKSFLFSLGSFFCGIMLCFPQILHRLVNAGQPEKVRYQINVMILSFTIEITTFIVVTVY